MLEQQDDDTRREELRGTGGRSRDVLWVGHVGLDDDARRYVLSRSGRAALLGLFNGTLEQVEITRDGETFTRAAQAVVAALGFVADLGAMKEWGLDLDKRHVVVDSRMHTNLPRVLAAGDITEYPGKVRLIAVGFGEAATAVNNAAVVIDPSAHVFPGHSSEGT